MCFTLKYGAQCAFSLSITAGFMGELVLNAELKSNS